jgi:tetratricopeptide (TPR) repeat protein
MRICLAAKEQRGQSLPLFVEFLRIWFTPAELKGLDDRLVHQARDYELYRDAIEESRRRADARVSFERQKIREDQAAGEEDLALARLRLLNQHAPEDLWAWYALRDLLAKRREFAMLIAAAELRTDLFPEDGRAWDELGDGYRVAGNFEAALEASTRAIALSPDETLFWLGHLAILRNLNRRADLTTAATNALRIKENSGNHEYWSLRAWCLGTLRRPEEAARAWITGISLRDDDYWSWGWLRSSLSDLGARRSRANVAKLAIELFPDSSRAWRGYFFVLASSGSYQAALEAIDKAIRLSPGGKSLECERGRCLLQLNDLPGAQASFDHFDAWRKSTPDPYQFVWKTHVLLAGGDRTAARRALVAYLDNLKAQNALGDAGSPIAVVERTKDPVAWAPYISLWLEVFAEQAALAALGPALVRGMLWNPHIMTPAVARDWTRAWQQAAWDLSDLRIPLRMMDVAVSFMETEDRSVLLDLPIEQRSLLEPEIDRYLRASGKVRHEIDDAVDALLETVRQRRLAPEAPRTVLPTAAVDSARIDSLLKTYAAGRRLRATLRPLVRAAWSAVPKKSAGALVRALADSGPDAAALLSRPDLTIRRLDQCALVFAKGHLYQAHIDLSGRTGAVDFWSDGVKAIVFDGSSAPIHELIRGGAFDITGSNELAYLTFYCSSLRAEDGRFEIVDPTETAIAEAVHARNPEIPLMAPTPTTFEGKPAYTAHMVYRNRLSRVVLCVKSDAAGVVDFLSNEPLIEDLALPLESFDGPIRLWAGA